MKVNATNLIKTAKYNVTGLEAVYLIFNTPIGWYWSFWGEQQWAYGPHKSYFAAVLDIMSFDSTINID